MLEEKQHPSTGINLMFFMFVRLHLNAKEFLIYFPLSRVTGKLQHPMIAQATEASCGTLCGMTHAVFARV
jgi:hypothetical protein